MVSFTFLAVALTTVSAVFAHPRAIPTGEAAALLGKRAGTPSSTGTHNGFYYSFWTDGLADVTYTNEAAGKYSVTWSGDGNWVGGKGWGTGSAR